MIYFNWNRITVYYYDGFWHIHQHESATWIRVSPYSEYNSNLLCYPMLWVLPLHKSCMNLSGIELALVIPFIYGNVPVSMLFSQIIPSLNSPLESQSLSFIRGSFLLAFMQNHCYCLPKSHLYALVNNICLSHSNFFFTLNNRLQVELPHSKWHKYMFFCS